MCLDESYRDFFIRNLHDALSGHTSNNVDEAVKQVLFFCYQPFHLVLISLFLLSFHFCKIYF